MTAIKILNQKVKPGYSIYSSNFNYIVSDCL